MTQSPPIRINVWEMRWLFKRHQFLKKIDRGELTSIVKRDTHPSRVQANEPFCTRTQELHYLDANRQEVARVHQYLRTDGTIGASGLPDPKRIKVGSHLYAQHTKEHIPTQGERLKAFLLRTALWVWNKLDR